MPDAISGGFLRNIGKFCSEENRQMTIFGSGIQHYFPGSCKGLKKKIDPGYFLKILRPPRRRASSLRLV